MKVLITRNADTANFGGAETYVVQLAEQLHTHGINVIVGTAMPRLSEALESKDILRIKAPWLSWQKWHGFYTPLVVILYVPWIIRLTAWYYQAIATHKPDVLHPMNRDDWIAASIAGKVTKTPVLWTDHADLKHELTNVRSAKNLLGKTVYFWAKRAQGITVVSRAEQEAIRESVGTSLDKQTHVVYNGVTRQFYEAAQKPKNTLVVGITARLRMQKGLRELIDAFKQVHAPDGTSLELWLIGDGPDEQSLRDQANDDRIKFLGFKKNWLDYVAACDIYAFPSYTEGFSLALIEAAMLSRPIVATAVGGNPEIIQHESTGLLIDAQNVEQLSTAIQQLIDHPEQAERLGAQAHIAWRNNFQFNQIVEQKLIPLYRSLVDDSAKNGYSIDI